MRALKKRKTEVNSKHLISNKRKEGRREGIILNEEKLGNIPFYRVHVAK